MFLIAYRWLGHYCGYCPQVWLSLADIDMTGYGQRCRGKAPKRDDKDSILFGFDIIRGFPIDFEFWCGHFLNGAINMPKATVTEMNRHAADRLDE